jgi:mRNA interferase MazF
MRGAIYRYEPKGSPRRRDVLIVSADGINDSTRSWLFALDVRDGDSGDLLTVRLPDGRWADGCSLTRVYREWLAGPPQAHIGEDTLRDVEAMLRSGLDL